MTFFRKITKKNTNGSRERIAEGLAFGIKKLQSYWVTLMGNIMARVSVKTQRIFFALYFVMMLSCFSYVIYKSLMNWHDKSLVASVSKHQSVPVHLSPFAKPKQKEEIPYKIKAFRLLLDSLARTEKGKHIRDSLLNARPGLLDSLNEVEQLYK